MEAVRRYCEGYVLVAHNLMRYLRLDKARPPPPGESRKASLYLAFFIPSPQAENGRRRKEGKKDMENESRQTLAIEFHGNLPEGFEVSVKRERESGTGAFMNTLPHCPATGVYTGAIAEKYGETYTGDRRDLAQLLGREDWTSTFFALHGLAKNGAAETVKAGDYIRIPVKAAAGCAGSLVFEVLDIENAELVVAQTAPDRIILNFEEVLFFSAVNAKNTNEGGFKNSALFEYLNTLFLDALDPVREILAKNRDGCRVTLPTLYEVFGDGSEGKDVNWEEAPRQLEYFKRIKNRIRIKDNDTERWWLGTPFAASMTHFCYVNSGGSANDHYASNTFGVAPAICII
jgi:hypothetical protein